MVGADAGQAADRGRALLAAHVAGDPEAFGEMVRRHRDRLWAVALRTMGDPEEAADAVQDGLLSASATPPATAVRLRSPPGCTASWSTPAWTGSADARCDRRCRCPRTRATNQPTRATGSASARSSLEVEQALLTLPEEQRAAIVLVDVEGYSVEEAAAILDCPTGTIKSRGARADGRGCCPCWHRCGTPTRVLASDRRTSGLDGETPQGVAGGPA